MTRQGVGLVQDGILTELFMLGNTDQEVCGKTTLYCCNINSCRFMHNTAIANIKVIQSPATIIVYI